jgi:hypothetical protein
MSNRDHLMGYAPAAGHQFEQEPDWWHMPYPLGTPRRVYEAELARRIEGRERKMQHMRERLGPLRVINTMMRPSDARELVRRGVLPQSGPAAKKKQALGEPGVLQRTLEALGMEIARGSAEMTQKLEMQMQATRDREADYRERDDISAEVRRELKRREAGIISDYHRGHPCRVAEQQLPF